MINIKIEYTQPAHDDIVSTCNKSKQTYNASHLGQYVINSIMYCSLYWAREHIAATNNDTRSIAADTEDKR